MLGDDDDDSFGSAIDEDEDDKNVRRQMLHALGGVGFFALMGLAGKQILKLFGKKGKKDTQDADGGMDMTNVADQAANVNDLAVAGNGATQNTTAFQASTSASQSQMSMTGGFGMNPGGGAGQAASGNTMSAAQSQVMQNMAVNAASNAASSAASAASGLASAASAAAAAGAAAATTTAAVSTIVAVVRSSLYDKKCGALVFASLTHLSLSFVTM
jgi:hypothetical protein